MKHVHLSECDSTQDVLKEQLHGKAFQEILVSCEHQKQGRGRGEHTWLSMPGTLCFSFSAKAHSVASWSALEMSTLVTRFFEFEGSKLKLKWPNDIWNHENKKCCGILIQNTSEGMLVGIGINLFSSQEDFGGIYISPFEFDKKAWAQRITDFIHQNRYQSTEQLKLDWSERCFHLFQEVIITEGFDIHQGIFEGLGVHGEALIFSEGKRRHLFNGSLTLV